MASSTNPLPPAPAADAFVHGGSILVMDQADTVTDAVLIVGGRVAAVGDAARAAAPKDVPRYDLGGRTAMPGLVDGHLHVTQSMLEGVCPYFTFA